MHSWIDRRNCLSLVPKNISCWALTMQRTRVIQFYEDTFVLCLFARKRPSCRYEENTTDFVLPYPMSLSRVLCGYVRPPTSGKSITVQMSFPELLLGQRAWCGPQDSDFSTGDYYAHENPMVYTRLLLPQIKWHSGPELCFLAIFGGRDAKTLSRGQEPQGLKVLWSSGSCHLLCTGRGELRRVSLTPPHSLPPCLLPMKALPMAHCPCSQSSLPSLLLMHFSLPQCQTEILLLLSALQKQGHTRSLANFQE